MKRFSSALLLLGLCFSLSAADKKLNIAMLLKTLSDPFWVEMSDGIKAEAKKIGVNVDIYAVDSEQDIEGQLKKLEDIVRSGSYDGIGIAPITGTNLITGLVAANKARIPVVNIDAKIDEKALASARGYVVGFATSDNYKVGQTAAEYVIKQIPAGGKVAVIEGRAGDLSSILRCNGFSE